MFHSYFGLSIDKSDFNMQGEFYKNIKSLSNNPNIIICKPDEGSGLAILNDCDYIEKINKGLSDDSKFKCLDITTEKNNIAMIDIKFQRQLLKLTRKMVYIYSGLFIKSYVLLVLKDQESMDYLKSIKRTPHFFRLSI